MAFLIRIQYFHYQYTLIRINWMRTVLSPYALDANQMLAKLRPYHHELKQLFVANFLMMPWPSFRQIFYAIIRKDAKLLTKIVNVFLLFVFVKAYVYTSTLKPFSQ